jgi:hypothetical protein
MTEAALAAPETKQNWEGRRPTLVSGFWGRRGRRSAQEPWVKNIGIRAGITFDYSWDAAPGACVGARRGATTQRTSESHEWQSHFGPEFAYVLLFSGQTWPQDAQESALA